MKIWWKGFLDAAAMWVAWHLPRRVVYWCAMRVGAHGTQDEYSTQIVPELLFMDAVKRWSDDAGTSD